MTDDEKRAVIRRAADQNRAALDRVAEVCRPPEPTPETNLWQFAIRVPEGRAADLTRLINGHGYEVYRAWPVSKEGA